MKKITIKYDLMQTFYYIYIIELIILIMIPLFTSYFIEYLEVLKYTILGIAILAVIFPITACIIAYFIKKQTVVFTESLIDVKSKEKPIELPLDKIAKMTYVPNIWYKLQFIAYYDGGILEITHKNGKKYKIRVFKRTLKKLIKELGYQIEILTGKINIKKSFK